MNMLLEYLYRDAGNNKIWGEMVFVNRSDLGVDVLDKEIRGLLIDGEFFNANQVGLPPLYYYPHDDELDHGWHEYYSIKATAYNPNDNLGRDICDFIGALRAMQV